MSSASKILDFLSPHALEQLYEGHSEAILLVLDKKVISGGLIRLKVRDAVHMDGAQNPPTAYLMYERAGTLPNLVF